MKKKKSGRRSVRGSECRSEWRSIALFAVCFVWTWLIAIDAWAIPIPRTRLGAGLLSVPEQGSGDGRFGETGFFVHGAASLYSQSRPDSWSRHSSLSVRALAARESDLVALLGRTVDLNRAETGLTGGTLSRGGELYMIRLGIGFLEETGVEGVDWMSRGAAVSSWHWNRSAALLYGGAYSYLFGEPLFLPALGVMIDLASGWRFTALLPFSVQATHRSEEEMDVTVFARAAGTRAHIAPGAGSGEQDLFLRLQRTRVGGGLYHVAEGGLRIGGEAGVEIMRKISIGDDAGVTLDSTPIETGFFMLASIQIGLGSQSDEVPREAEKFNELESVVPFE